MPESLESNTTALNDVDAAAPIPAAEPRVFTRTRGTRAPLLLALGVLAIVAAVGGFILVLWTDVSPVQLQMMTTLPTLAGMALIGTSLRRRSQLQSVTVDDGGVTLVTAKGSRHLPWTQIAWNAESLQPLSNVPRSTLYGSDGGVLARIPGVVDGFGELIILINRRIKSQPTAQAEQVRRARLKRQSLLVIGFGLVLLATFSFLIWTDIDEARRSRRLASEAVDGLATVERKFVAPDGHTKRVEYRVDAARADGTRPDLVNVELEPFVWDLLNDGGKLPVSFVPADPDISRVALGQRPDGLQLGPLERTLIFGGGGLLTIFLLVAGTLNRFGVDVVLDSETKRIRIARSVAK